MPITNETLDGVERVLAGMISEYNRINFMQRADYHGEACTCIRCWRDAQTAALARLREERKADDA